MARHKKNTPQGNDISLQEPAAAAGIDSSDTAMENREPASGHKTDLTAVVGVGASAGGLEALDAFLSNVPADSGLAFVVIQHLDPTHKGILHQLLQRITTMRVFQVEDRTRIEANCVYVIPPNADMSILHGVLHLLAPHEPRGLRLPIDYFFRSLAEDQQDRSIGVILSGMGADGTVGLRAIRDRAGATFVQLPSSAKFDGMPCSAVNAGVADVVDVVEALPQRIVDYIRHAPTTISNRPRLDEYEQSGIEKVAILLRSKTGHDFSLYKRSTLYRRIERRMGLHQLADLTHYVRFLQENPAEVDLLFKELLIGVTGFFRDPTAWDKLKSDVLPELLAERRPDRPLRAWVSACSTGEEAYSLAITFKEVVEKLKLASDFSLQIFATDLDSDAIERARAGSYPPGIASDMSPERLHRFFVQTEGGYNVNKAIREMVVFAPQNIIMDPPFTRLDILCCRNLLIYMTPDLQRKLLPLFHYSLTQGGVLFLGTAETTGGFGEFFEPIDASARLYRRKNAALLPETMDFPSALPSIRPGAQPVPITARRVPNLQVLADKLLLQQFSPAAVLVNDQGDILYINGRTGAYLEPAAGKANWNIFAMAREGLRFEMADCFRRALQKAEAVTVRKIKMVNQGETRYVTLTVLPITEPEALRNLVLVVLADVPGPSDIPEASTEEPLASGPHLRRLERELEQARYETQTVREEMQASQEELKSSNEEMQSMNEELQSTNEELTTSKEEMQSMNEELQSVNHEMQAKLEDLARLNSDMKNLLESTEIAILFLDEALLVRLFTEGARKIFRLIPGDVGRPITDIASALEYPELANRALEVLRTLIFHEEQIPTKGTDWYRVRIMPYRSVDNRIDGVVITFTDITVSKTLEARLRESKSGLEAQIATQAAKDRARDVPDTSG